METDSSAFRVSSGIVPVGSGALLSGRATVTAISREAINPSGSLAVAVTVALPGPAARIVKELPTTSAVATPVLSDELP